MFRWATLPVTAPRCQLRGKAGAEEEEDADGVVSSSCNIVSAFVFEVEKDTRKDFHSQFHSQFHSRILSQFHSQCRSLRRWAGRDESRRDGLLQLWSKGTFGQVGRSVGRSVRQFMLGVNSGIMPRKFICLTLLVKRLFSGAFQ